MKKTIFLLFALTVFGVRAEVYRLDLDNSIAIARGQSVGMLNLKQDVLIAEYSYKASRASMKTHIDLSLNLPQYTETIRSFEDTAGISYYPVKQLNYSANLSVNQPLITNGRIYLTSGLTNTDDIYNSMRLMNLNARLGLSQPLDVLYGYNATRNRLRQAKLNYEQSQKSLRRQDLDLVYNVMSSFYSLLQQQKSHELSKTNLERQEETYQLACNKLAVGLIKEVDVLQMEVDLASARNSYELSTINLKASANSFKQLIGLNISDSVVLAMDIIDYKPVMVDEEKAVTMAMQNRLEIREYEIQRELREMSVKQQKAAGLPSATLTAYIEKSGVSRRTNQGEFIQSLQEMGGNFIERPQNFGVGLSVSVPILDFGENKSQVRQAEANLKKTLNQQDQIRRSIESEVRNLVAEVNTSLKRLQLLEKNIEVAEKSFAITMARFTDGDIDSQALALERDRLNNAYTTRLSAYISYQLKLADLMRNTFYDFVADRPID